MSSGEADCTGSGGSGFILEPPLSSLIKNNNKKKINNNNNEDTDCELEKSVCGSTNNANAATAAAATTTTDYSTNFTNGSATLDSKILLKCERCDNFETISHALLLVHLAKCGNDSVGTGASSSSRTIAASGDAGGDSATESETPQVTAEASTSGPQAISGNKGDADTQGNAQQHQRKLFECDVCNMKFSNGANMRRHKMRHTGTIDFELLM